MGQRQARVRYRGWMGVAVAILILGTLSSPARSIDPSPAIFRSVHAYPDAPVATVTCGGFDCAIVPPRPTTVHVPESLGQGSVLVTATLEYISTGGAGLLVKPALGVGPDPATGMQPGALRFRAGSLTTATGTWHLDDVRPDELTLAWTLRGIGGTRPFEVVIQEMVVVVEVTPDG